MEWFIIFCILISTLALSYQFSNLISELSRVQIPEAIFGESVHITVNWQSNMKNSVDVC